MWTPLYYVKGMSLYGPVSPKHEHRKTFTVQYDEYGFLFGEVEDFYGILKLLMEIALVDESLLTVDFCK